MQVGSADGVVASASTARRCRGTSRCARGGPTRRGCADVPGDAVLPRHGDDALTVLEALGASDDHEPTAPAGATLVEVGGVRFWSFDTP